MGMTISEKIISRAAHTQVKAGDIVWADVDIAMMDDILGPRVEIAQRMEELGAAIWDADKVVIISDHYTPPANALQAGIVKFTREWARTHGVKNYHEFIGPCHQIMVEMGYVHPGRLIMGTDSHTCMGGALGAFASGIGSTEMVGILAGGQIWLRVPETIAIECSGPLPAGVMAKDLSLAIIGAVGHAGATYKAVEYVGTTIDSLSMDERLAITNMAVEMGAKAGLMNTDAVTRQYLQQAGCEESFPDLASDRDAVFCQRLNFRADTLSPMLACPHEVDNVIRAEEADKGIHIDQAYIGSCTGGRYSDLAAAARLLQGRKVKSGSRLLVSPASKSIWEQAARDGLLSTLSAAGAVVLAPTCGVCVGLHSGALADGECCISSTNRNFVGRMGSKKARTYLASPLTVAAAAVAGEIIDPRELL
jgi:3-isopropylmalate/(R)-2-methylmalate dehydratase large subunit